MQRKNMKPSLFPLMFSVIFFFHAFTPTIAVKQTYIVYMGGHDHGVEVSSLIEEQMTNTHTSLLATYLGSTENINDAIIYSYTKNINGFAAQLEEEEANAIAKHPDVVSVFPSRMRQLHTTHSWNFMDMEKDDKVTKGSLYTKGRFGEDVIIANIDTGVWPESESFNDEGMGPIPSRWKGICQNKTAVPCNRKLIGARYYYKGIESLGNKIKEYQKSPRDYEGHGSHTLSTAGGRFVPNASIYGNANGTAKGGSPRAHVAAYKVCWPKVGCHDADILAAYDQAIEDGVDVISGSLGGDPQDFSVDAMAIATFHAMRKGVAVVCSAGNSGPLPYTVSNGAPWILTVGASSVDRSFPSTLKLGDGKEYTGQSLSESSPHMLQKFYPLINSADAALSKAKRENATLCYENSLDPEKVKGRVVICYRGISARVGKGVVVKKAGGVAMILANDESSGNELIADPHFLPATHISYKDGQAVYKYINSSKSPVAYLTPPSTKLGTKPAPIMAAFSSRGPNSVVPEILKPDITAPGMSILAAYTGAESPTETDMDTRRVPYTIMSGTSMSCPHVAGIVGLLKNLHPDWSIAAIRSAIMTTARTRDNNMEVITDGGSETEEKADPFAYGAGHIRPNRAGDPGLVYDLSIHDYFNYLCNFGYSSEQIQAISGSKYKCPSHKSSLLDFNYPSITIPTFNESTTISRKVKNVGSPGTYAVKVHPPAGVSIKVQPSTLTFSKIGEEKTYSMTLMPRDKDGKYPRSNNYTFGRIIWFDGVHYVRSPIAVGHGKDDDLD